MKHVLAVTAILAGGTALCSAAELPTRKPGLWEVRMTFEGRSTGQTVQQCTDASTDALLRSPNGASSPEICSKRDLQTTADGMTVDSVCTAGGRSMASHVEITGSFDTAYHMTVTTKSADRVQQAGDIPELTMALDAKWLGDCKPDQKPGDIILPSGVKLNVQDMQGERVSPQPPGAPASVPLNLLLPGQQHKR